MASVIVPRYPVLVFAIAIVCAVAVSDVIARFYAEPLNRWLRTILLAARPPHPEKAVPVPSAAA